MTLYFDYHVNVDDPGAVHSLIEWHSQQPLLAVSSFSHERGGSVTICDELGEIVQGAPIAAHPSAQATSLAWHPKNRTLAVAWETGEIRVWTGETDYVVAPTEHSASILVAKWSNMGGRFASADTTGSVIVWRIDSRGILCLLWRVELKEAVSILEFRRGGSGAEMAELARRAVAGDQRALDIFSAWRPRTAGHRATLQPDNLAFYIAVASGSVHYINESGQDKEVLRPGGRVQKLLYHQRIETLIVATDGLNLGYYSVAHDGSLTEITMVKLSGSQVCSGLVWAGQNVLACAVGDISIRLWQPSTGHTASLSPDQTQHAINVPKQMFTALAFSHGKGVLCGCTNAGLVVFWRATNNVEGWQQLATCRVQEEGVKQCTWGPDQLAVNTTSSVFILREHSLCAVCSDDASAVQMSASELVVTVGGETAQLNTDLQVSGVAISRGNVAVWNGKTMAVYQLTPVSSLNAVGLFSSDCESGALYEQSAIVLESCGKVLVRTLQGTVKQALQTEGQAISIALNGPYLTVATISGMLHIWDLSRREAKVHTRAKDITEMISDFGEVMCARSNRIGTMVAITIAGSSLLPAPYLYVWDIETDTLHSHHCVSLDSDDITRFVVNHFWDTTEPRLIVCEAKLLQHQSSSSAEGTANVVLVSFIASAEHGLLVQALTPMDQGFVSLLAVDAPHFVVLTKQSPEKPVHVDRLLMTDFEGLETCDASTKSAVINFSFSLGIGDLDQAFKAILNLKSVAVWSSLARMCVKAKRLDVAGICLGHMKDVRGVAALRSAAAEPELEARVASLAIHLGLIEEAEKLYESCGRYDLLNRLYQNSGRWEEALRVAEGKDRVHLRNTYHLFGRHLEVLGELETATRMYERADTHRQQVPRMLLNDPEALELYIHETKDPVLVKWWAQYMESTGDMELALKYYREANDNLSTVRVLCYLEDYGRAADIANSCGDRAACYHLARQYENMERIQEAVHFFTRARAYANAIRICKESKMEEQLWGLALSSGARDQLEVAKHLEPTAPDKAVLLYHRAGMLHRALDLAFRCEQFDAVQLIAAELNSDSDAELLLKCAQFFIEKEHYERAASLLANAKHYVEAVALCWDQSVILTEELAETLSPPQGHPERAAVLEKIADCALSHANYHLATKKFTQAGNKVKAMKALLKSGDTEKIIFFATVSRQQEIYIMAANYLQSLDWHAKPDLLKGIVTFYTKGRAPHLLANFYVACAQDLLQLAEMGAAHSGLSIRQAVECHQAKERCFKVEVDEYGNYEKALGALTEASRCLAKDTSQQYNQIKESVESKMALVNKFIDTRRLFERGGADTGLVQCRHLLKAQSDLVRHGDIYSLMIEHAAKCGDWKGAGVLASEMQTALPHDNLAYYLTKDVLERLGLAVQSTRTHQDPEEEEEVVEDQT